MTDLIIVAGYGPVGKAIASALITKYSVVSVDPAFPDNCYKDIGSALYDLTELQYAHVIGIVCCVSTPMNDDGSCNTKNVEEILKAARQYELPVLLKSTTDIDFVMKNSDIVTFSPEFLSSETVPDTTKQYAHHKFEIFGGDNKCDLDFWINIFNKCTDREIIVDTNLFDSLFLKYTENAFLAMKVTFFNEMKILYEQMPNKSPDCSFEEMIATLQYDVRMGKSHMQVPGPNGEYGYGGHCLPKDTNAMIVTARRNGKNAKLLEFMIEYNKEIRGENK